LPEVPRDSYIKVVRPESLNSYISGFRSVELASERFDELRSFFGHRVNSQPHSTPGTVAQGRETMTSRNRRVIMALLALIVVVVLLATQVTIFVVHPMRAVPKGRTLVISRLTNTRFIDSAEGICDRTQNGVSLLCRGTVLTRVMIEAHVYARLPYSKTLYLISTGGKEYDR
jgi:hypothetical protein